MTSRIAAIVLLLAVLPTASAAQTRDPFIGKWILNPDKSTYESGRPPKSFTRTYEDRGGGVVLMTIEGVNAQGAATLGRLVYKRDGQEYPEAAIGVQTIRMVSVTAVDAYTEQVTFKVDGNVTSTATTLTVSRDGRTMTQRLSGTNAAGQRFTNTVVYDKQ